MHERPAWRAIPFALLLGLLSLGAVDDASAQATFTGPLPYLSSADIPAGFYAATGGDFLLDNFEDCSLDFGITASAGEPIANNTGGGCTGFSGIVDSVDADDGSIDGSGSLGRSWFFGAGSAGVTFTFSPPAGAAGAVWTDGEGSTTFEAFGPGMVSLGTIGPVAIADGNIVGGTAEDRFFGVQDAQGIVAIRLSNTSGGIEIDHVQLGGVPTPVPLLAPAAWWTLALGAVLISLGLLIRSSGRRPSRIRGAE